MAASTSLDLPEGPELTPDSPFDEVFSNIVTPPRFSLYDSIVHVLVGSHEFGMDKGLLCYHSPFFKAGFTGPYKEAFDGILVLGDESHHVFSLFNHWANDPTILRYLKPLALIDLYAFAEERLVRRLQNDVVDICVWHAMHKDSMDAESLHLAWRQTLRLRPLLVDLFIKRGDLNGIHTFNSDFARANAVRSTELQRVANPRSARPGEGLGGWAARCAGLFKLPCYRFHVHEREDPICGGES